MQEFGRKLRKALPGKLEDWRPGPAGAGRPRGYKGIAVKAEFAQAGDDQQQLDTDGEG